MQVRQVLVLHFQELFQLAYILFQGRDTLIGVRQGLVGGYLVFHPGLGPGATGAMAVGLGKADLILVLVGGGGLVVHLGTHLASSGLAGIFIPGGGLGSGSGQLTPVGVPVGRLGEDDLFRFGGRNLGQGALFRHGENATGLQPVHVAPFKSPLVGLVQAHQHLLQGNPFRLGLGGDLMQGFAPLHLVAGGGAGFRRRGRSGRRGSAAALFRHPGLISGMNLDLGRSAHGHGSLGAGDPGRTAGFHGGHLGGGLGPHFRRIQEEGVFPGETAGAPIHFHQHIHEGIVDGVIGGNADHRPSVIFLVQGEMQSAQGGGVFQPGVLEGFPGGQTGGHFFQLRLGCRHLHLSPQGLPQAGQDGDFPQTRRIGGERHTRKCGSQQRGSYFHSRIFSFCHGATLSVQLE